MSCGRLFRNFGAANMKARSPRVFDDFIGGKRSKAHGGQQVVSDFYGKLEFQSPIARHYFNNFVDCELPKLHCVIDFSSKLLSANRCATIVRYKKLPKKSLRRNFNITRDA